MRYIKILEDLEYDPIKEDDLFEIGTDITPSYAGALIHAGKAKFVNKPDVLDTPLAKPKAVKAKEEDDPFDVGSDSDINEEDN